MCRILVAEPVEDETGLLIRQLQAVGHDVICCTDGVKAASVLDRHSVDLCILDIDLPGFNGFRLARKICEKEKNTPFIFLTSRDLLEDKVAGLKAGAEDYIAKPFHLEEALLRIEIILKRHHVIYSKEPGITLAGAELYHQDREIHHNNDVIRLSAKEAELLYQFFNNCGTALSRSQLLQRIWQKDDYYASKSLDVYLTRIRKIIRKIGNIDLQNVHGYGYKLVERHA